MFPYLRELLHSNPNLVFFVVLGFGYLLGKIKIRGFEFGPVAGVLFVGLILGHYGYGTDLPVQSIGFVIFIFAVGMQAGPKFFSVIRTDGLRYLLLAVVVSSSGFAVAFTMSSFLGFEPGTSAGILAGGLTSSPTLAAAQEAVRGGIISPPEGSSVEEMITNITTGYAITYIFGLAGLLIIIRLIPKLSGIDLPAEAEKLANKEEGKAGSFGRIVTRAYLVTKEDITGIPFSEMYTRSEGFVAIHKIKRDGEFIAIDAETTIELEDRVSFVGTVEKVRKGPEVLGPEITDADLLDAATESCHIVVTNKKMVGAVITRRSVTKDYGCLLTGGKRLGVEMPVDADVVLERGDVLSISGPQACLDRMGDVFGHIEREIIETDMLTVALGIAAGIIIGSLSVKIAGISVGLGSAGGLLTAGLTIGFLRSIHPTFGRIPDAALWVFMEMGLLFFMAGVGLRAGKGIIEALISAGPLIFLAGALVTIIPVSTGYLFGRFVLRINPVLLLGAVTGSMTSGACLSIVTREAKSAIPSLGYTGAYAFANVLLTVAGSIILLF